MTIYGVFYRISEEPFLNWEERIYADYCCIMWDTLYSVHYVCSWGNKARDYVICPSCCWYVSPCVSNCDKKKEIIGNVSDGGSDEPDDRDYLYEEVFWSVETVKKVQFPKSILKIQDQSAKKDTGMACSRFWGIHIHNAQQIIEHWPTFKQIEARGVWLMYLKINSKAEQEGATLQSVLKQLKDLGYIAGFAKCITDEQRKQAIDRGQRILSWSLYGDWWYVRDHKIYRDRTDGVKAWHIYSIIWYDDTGWEAINSFWPSNGYFKIPYEFTGSLFSTYALIDKDETGELQAHKDKLLLEQARNLWIWNWNDPQKQVTREEAVLMLMRSRNVA